METSSVMANQELKIACVVSSLQALEESSDSFALGLNSAQ